MTLVEAQLYKTTSKSDTFFIVKRYLQFGKRRNGRNQTRNVVDEDCANHRCIRTAAIDAVANLTDLFKEAGVDFEAESEHQVDILEN